MRENMSDILMKDCKFCKIVKRLEKSYIIYEDENTVAFAPSSNTIIAKRHLLIVPKKHYESIYDIPETELLNLMETAKKISHRLKSKFNAQGINILHASGAVAQQSIFHFHLHLLPRYFNDQLDLWPETGYKEDNFPEIYLEMKDL